MINQQLIDGLSEQFSQLLSGKASLPGQSLAKEQITSILQGTFDRFDLVSREEFDAQRAVLLRTREKVEQLEIQLAVIEQVINQSSEKE